MSTNTAYTQIATRQTGRGYRLDCAALANVPDEMKQTPNWVMWKYVTKPRATKPTKLPFQRDGRPAKANDPSTWTTFDAVEAEYRHNPQKWAGIGYEFGDDDGLCGIDLDNALDVFGSMENWAMEVFNQIGGENTYGEVSPSGRGLKLIIKGRIEGAGKRMNGRGPDSTGAVEVYDRARFFTITGERYNKCSPTIGYADEGLDELYASLVKPKHEGNRETVSQFPSVDDREKRCMAYIAKLPDSISGQGGHDRCLQVACETVRFGLDAIAARRVMQYWSDRRSGGEPWTDQEIEHKLQSAEKKAVRGERLKNYARDFVSRNRTSSNYQPPEDFDGAVLKNGADRLVIDFPEIIPLDKPNLPSMPDGIFKGPIADMIAGVAAHTETPRELGAATALAVLATVCQKRLSVCVHRGYFEQLSIYAACAMEAGTRKSGGQRPFIDPLLDIESEKAVVVAAQIQKALSERKTVEARLTRMRADAGKATKPEDFSRLKNEIIKLEESMPAVPHPPQMVVQDITSENLPTLMSQNDERMGLFSDEGGSFDTMAGRYSNGVANIDVYLQSHNGSFVRVSRGSRPSINLKHPALSMGLVMQPDVIKGLAEKPGFRGRGLLARFAYFLPDPCIGYRKLVPIPLDEDVTERYSEVIRMLAMIEPRDMGTKSVPHVVGLGPHAAELWKTFQREVEVWMRPGEQLEHARDWGGKLPGLVARVAGLLHAASFYSDPTAQSDIDGGTMERAIAFGRYLVPQALAAFSLMGADESIEIARRLWAAVASTQAKRAAKAAEAAKDPHFVTLRDMWHPMRRTYGSPADVEGGAQKLCDLGYLVELSAPSSGKYKPRKYKINPAALEMHR